ncbi:MAG: type IV pilus secretin PilQ [Acidiferrobacterales bacterium]|nr:type IV pilus secretin PilQ [Acidiferrobacterales bacterium]
MKFSGIIKTRMMGRIGFVASAAIILSNPAFAAQLESMEVSGSDLRQIVDMSFDDYPRYEITELSESNGIMLTFRGATIAGAYEPPSSLGNGLITRLDANPSGPDTNIEINLDSPSKYTLTQSDGGYQLALIPLARQQQSQASAVGGELTGLNYSRISGDRVQIDLNTSGTLPEPVVFRTVSPPRIALDFFGVKNTSGKQLHKIGIASVKSVVIAEDEERMRMIINLENPSDYSLDQTDNGLALTVLAGATSGPAAVTQEPVSRSASNFTLTEGVKDQHQINNVDFRRTPAGAGRVIVKLSDSELAVDLQEISGEIVAVFPNTDLPASLEQRLDVTDFATPVSTVDTFADGRDVRLVVTPNGQYKQSSVQSGDTLIIDIAPLSKAEIEAEKVDEFGYTGERLSLNFQQISVRAALQVIADFTGLNFVTSDAISGNLSLRLKDVPWDQALDVILQTKGLAMRQKGNVVWVAPAEEIAAKERQALEARQEVGELAPLVSELIPISYAKAEEIADILKSVKAVETGITQSAFGSVSLSEVKTEENTLLSSRGSVSVDNRTNSLLVQDTTQKLKEIRELISKLDIPVRQVQIETRIVEANDDFSKNIGARLGFSSIVQDAETLGNTQLGDTFTGATIGSNADTRLNGTLDNTDALSVNLPAGGIGTDAAASYAFSLARLGSGFLKLLDLELSALQAEGNGRIIANPKILTTDKNEASIEQGQERLQVFGSAFGTSATQGQKAVLSLTVRPQITPDDKITLDVDITNDSFAGVDDTVNTKRIKTQTLLENGETVVIGGIYSQEESQALSKVPFLGDIPYLGNLFKKRTARNNRSELLIFLTPRIIDPSLAVQ